MGILDATATGALVKINIDGKPLEKLIEVVSNGIGTLYRPRKIRKEAEDFERLLTLCEEFKRINQYG